MSTIYGVSEAFSMQPRGWYIGRKYQTSKPLSKIVLEYVLDTGDPYSFYVGYDEDGEKVFQIRVQCATVEFGQPKETKLPF